MADTSIWTYGGVGGAPIQEKEHDNGDGTFARAVYSIAAKGSKSAPTAVSVGTTATLILAANPNRKSAVIYNNAAASIYVGKDATVTTTNGMVVSAGAAINDGDSTDAWYGIVGSGTADVRVLEIA